MIYKKCSELLLRLRKEKRMSQEALAYQLSVNSQLFSNIERGLCKIPKKYLPFLAELFSVPEVEFIEAILADERAVLEKFCNEYRGRYKIKEDACKRKYRTPVPAPVIPEPVIEVYSPPEQKPLRDMNYIL